MIRDIGGRIVMPDDPRFRKRMGRPSTRTHNPPPYRKRQTCSLWPRLVWASCCTCRQTYRAAPRGGSYHASHDPYACYRQRQRWAHES